jgi:alkanesulfonate monooxygenase
MSRPPVEVSWFSALCDDDYEFLGVPDSALQSSFEHCRNIALTAEKNGFDNILLPSGYQLGIDNTVFAAGLAGLTKTMRMLLAVRIGEMWPPQMVRQIATLDRMMGGRLALNFISSEMPGESLASAPRYARTLEAMILLRAWLNGEAVKHDGDFYKFDLAPPRITTQNGKAPYFYFGGLSEDARETAAQGADVYLMWPDTLANSKAVVDDMNARAAKHGRTLKHGFRVHVVVRETESEARAAADRLLSKLDAATGDAIRAKSLDSTSTGVAQQAKLREASASNDGYVEDNLWTGIGRARSGCGAAIVGDPDQVLAKINAYRDIGFESFILSGYPHAAECDLFGRYVLPHLNHDKLVL